MKQITVGLDFGTHQTKVCIETKEGAELDYRFLQFDNGQGEKRYTLPSVLQMAADGTVRYGYETKAHQGKIIKYFKQSAFQTTEGTRYSQVEGMRYAIWYIAYILFDLEKLYGQDFAIQMGVPTDSSHLDKAKQTAVSIVVSAYKLVEEVFQGDKARFLATPVYELKVITKVAPYSQELKDEYGILVLPEAYACLKPLINKGKIAGGMSLMVDIGGGTTDMSFFTIKDGRPQIYDFFSLGIGLNYLTGADVSDQESASPLVGSASDIDHYRRNNYIKEINLLCNRLINNLKREYRKQTKLRPSRLTDALRTRPIVYCGGGSTFGSLRLSYGGFRVRLQITPKIWNTKAVIQMADIAAKDLCPILTTAYGLSISVVNDDIQRLPFEEVFQSLRGMEEEHRHSPRNVFGSAISKSGFDYGNDYDAWK